MNKRKIIVLVVCVLLVIGSILVWNFWLANSPSVQAWIHDWLENPLGLTAIATLGAAIGTVGAVIIALYGTRYEQRKAQADREESRRQFLASQKQTQDALEEGRRQFLEVQYAANRPLLVPEFYSYVRSPNDNVSSEGIRIRNDGTGIAMNITMLQSSAHNVLHTFLKRKTDTTSIGNPMIIYAPPIPKNGFYNLSEYSFNPLSENLTPNDKIGTYTLVVTEELVSKGHNERFIITYLDIFGRKYASVFDRVTLHQLTWIAFLSDIAQDINEMIEAKSKKKTKPLNRIPT